MKGGRGIRMDLLMALIALLLSPVVSDLIISKLDRKIDLRSQIVRMTSTLKVENTGSDLISDVLVAFPDHQAKNIALFVGSTSEVKGKTKSSTGKLSIKVVQPIGMPPTLTWYSLTLPKDLGKGESVTLDLKTVFTHMLKPFPQKITQSENQLVVFQDSAYFVSPYVVKVQSLSFKLPDTKIESHTKIENTKVSGSEIKYGPYENVPALQYSSVVIHFVSNHPFPVAQELVREIEISHWGNVQITEHYNLIHGGAQSTGEFSRLDYQARGKGAAAFRNLEAQLPLRAHSIYYRDEIGNISTSNFLPDSKNTILEIEPRYPMFGGWKTSFTIGYSLPLQDYLFQSNGKRFLNISFGCPVNDVLVEKLIVKVVLPEGSKDISVSTLFPVEQLEEIKFSHLDIIGRPVVVLQKENVIPEYNQPFQVYYKFSNFSLLREPLMLISGFFFLFLGCIVYMHADLTISKTSPSYLAKLQWDEVRATIQLVLNIIHQSLAIHDKLEGSLRDLSRTGDVQACKAARKAADSALKELSKELKPLLAFLQSLPQASHVVPKVEELVAKERELQEKLTVKHSTVVESYEKKSGGRDIESRIVAIQHKISVLRQEVDELVEFVDEI